MSIAPALFHWAVTAIEYEVTETGVKLYVRTNHPCVLYMRWTTEDPGKHIIVVDERGAEVGRDIRTCFVAYHTNKQLEFGDSYIHTFIKEPWPYCETRWFYFYAQVQGEWSPSESAIFHYHRFELAMELIILEPWSFYPPPPAMTRIINEPWSEFAPPPDFIDIIETWTAFSGTVMPPPLPWPFYEEWGKTLTENNPWRSQPPIGGYDYELYDGLIRLYNISSIGSSIMVDFSPSRLPLLDSDDHHLFFQGISKAPAPLTHDGYLAFHIFTTNGIYDYLIEFIISRGSWWGPWGSVLWGHKVTSGKDYGLDPGPIDLTAFWKWARNNYGSPSDPTGWYIEGILLSFEAVEYWENPYLINDFLGCFYSEQWKGVIIEPWTS